MIVYKIKNKINEKTYVGVTTFSLDKRIGDHIKDRTIIGKAIRKYGIQSFEIAVIDSASSKEVLFEKEKYWIKFYNSNSRSGYNLTDGGEGLINPSKSVRKRISETLKKNYVVTKGFTGRTHSEKSKRKISESCKKALASSKIRKKMSLSRKGKPFTEEHKRKIGLANKGNKRPDLAERNKNRKNQVPWNKDHNHPAYKAWQERLVQRNKEGCTLH